MTDRREALELHTDIGFVRREWVAQRVAWGLMLLTVVAAVAGVFGTGPLSSTTVRSGDGAIEVAYSRFLRVTAISQLDLKVASEAIEGGQIELWVSHEYLAAVDIDDILPEPSSASTSADGVTYTIEVEGESPAVISIDIKPTGVGPHAGDLGVVDGPQVRVNQFVYP